MASFKSFVVTFISISFLSCSTSGSIISQDKLESGLNSQIGKDARVVYLLNNNWIEIKNTEITKELEFKRSDGCSYAILIENSTNIVKSWRYTSEHALCKKNYYW
jgi:hypothetical protein